ncbi:type VI secretion system tube protein Hcp [Burkholderia pyrrocinia]|uniref:Hcp family type VI secretion system effector n=1 Tax=Burkholderia TaxID=32008 RepID=UPI00158E7BB1|nr:type VI secretion system tube protein Hcp [Burkholderia cenocepacia]EKS9886958.1 type VI secretion system tube protein Hcp [Burkholderia pyrrocinia]EKS9895913.1 type VI secretion system tube protein Hcp [Burkholderia pyrrocinia]EKS9908586.1 type VI secretion system tube protein Hcp [Burkholderia pyrrocinia]
MAADVFLKFDGIEGESQDKHHQDEIEVANWSWNVTQQSNMHAGSGGGAGRSKIEDVTFRHFVDRATPNLVDYCVRGKHVKSATLCTRRAGQNPQEYVTLKMEDVLITSVKMLGKSNVDDRLEEEVTLSFSKFEYEYKPQGESGGDKGAIARSFDIKANA